MYGFGYRSLQDAHRESTSGFSYSVDTRVLAKAIYVLNDIKRNYGMELERVFSNSYAPAESRTKAHKHMGGGGRGTIKT